MGTEFRQKVFLVLSVIGLISTWYFNIQYFVDEGHFSMTAFFRDIYSSHIGASLGNDIIVVAIAFLFWAGSEAKRHQIKYFWLYPILTVFIAAAFAIPLFLFSRERAISRNRKNNI